MSSCSSIEQIGKKHGWPLKIHSRGYDACLVDVQPLTEGTAPIYRWPGGDSIADDLELRCRAEDFHRLTAQLKDDPCAFYDHSGDFKAYPFWYKELALYAMECISQKYGPDHFAQHRNDEAGWITHHITKAVFEEQDLFDPYSDQGFILEAARLLPWYIKRYTER